MCHFGHKLTTRTHHSAVFLLPNEGQHAGEDAGTHDQISLLLQAGVQHPEHNGQQDASGLWKWKSCNASEKYWYLKSLVIHLPFAKHIRFSFFLAKLRWFFLWVFGFYPAKKQLSPKKSLCSWTFFLIFQIYSLFSRHLLKLIWTCFTGRIFSLLYLVLTFFFTCL